MAPVSTDRDKPKKQSPPPSSTALTVLNCIVPWAQSLHATNANLVAHWCANRQTPEVHRHLQQIIKELPRESSISIDDLYAIDAFLNHHYEQNLELEGINTKSIRWAIRAVLIATQSPLWLSPSERTPMLAVLEARDLVTYISLHPGTPPAEFIQSLAPTWEQSADELIASALQVGPLPTQAQST